MQDSWAWWSIPDGNIKSFLFVRAVSEFDHLTRMLALNHVYLGFIRIRRENWVYPRGKRYDSFLCSQIFLSSVQNICFILLDTSCLNLIWCNMFFVSRWAWAFGWSLFTSQSKTSGFCIWTLKYGEVHHGAKGTWYYHSGCLVCIFCAFLIYLFYW